MTHKSLFKKIAPVVMSMAVAMTSLPTAALAEDFSDADVAASEDASYEDVTEEGDAASEEEFVSEEEVTDVTEDPADEADAAVSGETEETFVDVDAFSDNGDDGEEEAEVSEACGYVLMNIPYNDFYKAEMTGNNVTVDAFTSATKNKSRTVGMMNGNAAYHTDSTGTKLAGVTFPVKVSDLAKLQELGLTQVTDESGPISYSISQRGQTVSFTLQGKETLTENTNYAYYVLSETPSYYKELSIGEDGSLSFSSVVYTAEPTTVALTSDDYTFSTSSSYGDY